MENSIDYSFYSISVCDQSPVIIQFQNASPFRPEPVDGVYLFNFDLYNNVLGRGKAMGVASLVPDPENSGKFRVVIRNVYISRQLKRCRILYCLVYLVFCLYMQCWLNIA